MLILKCENWSWDADLQIIHADVRLEADGEVLIDEPLCVDVGLPALLYSLYRDVEPDRWAYPEEYYRMPFFCCGCGDPECRAFSFRTRRLDGGRLELTELEERQGAKPKILGTYIVGLEEYRVQVMEIADKFLSFVKDLDYKPYFSDTVKVIEQLKREAAHGSIQQDKGIQPLG